MFAVFFSESMTPFYQNISSFPTVFFTFLLALCFLFWVVSILGVVDIDLLDIPDADMNNGGMANAAAGLLVKFGLNGVPITIILSLIALIGWTISYNAVHFLGISSWSFPLRWSANIGVFVMALYVATFLTAQIIKPIRGLFNKLSENVDKNILGQIAVVRTSRVDEKFGEAELDDGAAGLILKVRAFGDASFKKNDRVVLLEYLEADNVYRVIAESEFVN